MKLFAITALLTLASASAAQGQSPAGQAAGVRIYADQAHGEGPLAGPYTALAAKLGAEIVSAQTAITPEALKGFRLVVLRMPTTEISADESTAIVDFVRKGGSLLLAFDEERRASLATTRANEVIASFGMKLTNDTEYLHNTGAIAKKGVINAADREVPFSGGRAVEGGTPFAWQLDKDGKPSQAFAAFTTVGATGRVVVLGDAMATLFLGTPEGVRLTGVPRDPSRTTFWGKDSGIFMEELLTWLIK